MRPCLLVEDKLGEVHLPAPHSWKVVSDLPGLPAVKKLCFTNVREARESGRACPWARPSDNPDTSFTIQVEHRWGNCFSPGRYIWF